MFIKRKPIKASELRNGVEMRICNNQAELFVLAAKKGFDDDDFISKYMNSELCHEIDGLYSPHQLAAPSYNMACLLDEIQPEKTELHYHINAIWWIGYIYRYIQFRFDLFSSEIYKAIPVEKMIKWYEGMHTQGDEYFMSVLHEDYFQKKGAF